MRALSSVAQSRSGAGAGAGAGAAGGKKPLIMSMALGGSDVAGGGGAGAGASPTKPLIMFIAFGGSEEPAMTTLHDPALRRAHRSAQRVSG